MGNIAALISDPTWVPDIEGEKSKSLRILETVTYRSQASRQSTFLAAPMATMVV